MPMNEGPPTWVAHLDMDAFYASVELLRRPDLREQAMVVGGRRRSPHDDRPGVNARLRDYVGRGVITTATYPARHLGLHSGMGLMKAARLAPDAVLLPADFEAYRAMSARFKAAVAQRAPSIEDRGIDEIYIDLSRVERPLEDGEDELAGLRRLGQDLKDRVRAATGLNCSIGITPNKLLSKMASELDKPDGLTVLTHDDLPTRIWPLPVRSLPGVGPKAAERLQGLGLATLGELAACDPQRLLRHFGPQQGAWLHAAAWGRDDRAVVTSREVRSVSRETTFERDLRAGRDRQALGQIFTRLCEQVAADLRRQGLRARTVGIKLRYPDFRIVTRDLSLPQGLDDAADIRRAAAQCLRRAPLDTPLRLLGVRASGLCPRAEDEAMRLHAAEPAWGATLPLFT